MLLDPETCYRAMTSRDRRFEGQFVIGVTTTGIYCRPGCPAPLPKRTNVRFFACKAAAEESGLRACLRCRPDASPGTPTWMGTPATVARALRLIAEGALNDGGVDALAARLGMGERHLRRLFDKHLGASPLAVAQTERLHFARKLLEETSLPMTEVACAAGFASVRRFNDAAARAFRMTPTELRQRARASAKTAAGADPLALRLPYRPPLDWTALLAFLAARAIPGVERVTDHVYARTITAGETTGTLEARLAAGEPSVIITLRLRDRADLFPLVGRARRLFDLDADPEAIADRLALDPRLEPAVRARPGLRVPGAWDGFELAVRAVLGQQVTVRGATTLAGRLVERFGQTLPGSADSEDHDGLTRVFPTPEALADADIASIGLPRARAETIRGLAKAATAGKLRFEAPAGLEQVIAELSELPGVGPWTAHYIAMRAAREPDAFPSGDLVLRRRAATDDEPVTANALLAIAERWRPWRAYAAMHLWSADPPLAPRPSTKRGES